MKFSPNVKKSLNWAEKVKTKWGKFIPRAGKSLNWAEKVMTK